MKTGKVVEGSIYDCNKADIELALKKYDNQLYLKWNPHKQGGMGVWEIRRTPNQLSLVAKGEYKGQMFFEIASVEDDLIHHVLDVPALNYSIVNRIKEMDTWHIKNYAESLEQMEETAKNKELTKNKEDLKYAVRFHKKAFQDFQELLLSGRNPADILAGNW